MSLAVLLVIYFMFWTQGIVRTVNNHCISVVHVRAKKLPVASCDEVGTVLREADGLHLGGHLVARHLQGALSSSYPRDWGGWNCNLRVDETRY